MNTVISCGEDSKLVLWSTEKQAPIASQKLKETPSILANAKQSAKPYKK